MRDHPIFKDQESKDADTFDDWIRLFEKHQNAEPNLHFEGILIDLRYMRLVDKYPQQIHSYLYRVIKSYYEATDLENLSRSIHQGLTSQDLFTLYFHRVEPKLVLKLMDERRLDDLLALLKASVNYLGHYQFSSCLIKDWLNLLHLLEIVLDKKDNKLLDSFIQRYRELQDDVTTDINGGLFEWMISQNLIVSSFEDEALVPDDMASPIRVRVYQDLIPICEEHGIDQKAFIESARVNVLPYIPPCYIRSCYQNAAASVHFEWNVELHQSRRGEIFDENGVMTAWGITRHTDDHESIQSKLPSIYQAYGKTLTDEIRTAVETVCQEMKLNKKIRKPTPGVARQHAQMLEESLKQEDKLLQEAALLSPPGSVNQEETLRGFTPLLNSKGESVPSILKDKDLQGCRPNRKVQFSFN